MNCTESTYEAVQVYVCAGTSMGIISDTYGLCMYTNTWVKLWCGTMTFLTCTVKTKEGTIVLICLTHHSPC